MQNSKYLVANERDVEWGLTVSTVGYDEVSADEHYPTTGHAEGYFYDPQKGRILAEYQMLYLTEGEGVFASKHCPKQSIKAGDVFLLFPYEWHTYYPVAGSPWKSYWIGYRGRNMDDRVRAGFLSPEKPIYHVGYSADLIRLYKTAIEAAQAEAAFIQQHLAGIVNNLVGYMYSLERNMQLSKNTEHIRIVSHAQQRIRETVEYDIDLKQLAGELNISYSYFRKLFKEHTGMSPRMYQQELKMQRAKELLTTTDLSVKEIAFILNFDSPDYFSSKFHYMSGCKPSEFRKKTSVL